MTEPTEAQIKEACEKANALIRTIVPPNVLTKISVDPKTSYIDDAFVRLVMEHEAFRQRVSEFAKRARIFADRGWQSEATYSAACDLVDRAAEFIQPDPTPTPEQVLEKHWKEAFKDSDIGANGGYWRQLDTFKKSLLADYELAKRGHHVAPIKGKGDA